MEIRSILRPLTTPWVYAVRVPRSGPVRGGCGWSDRPWALALLALEPVDLPRRRWFFCGYLQVSHDIFQQIEQLPRQAREPGHPQCCSDQGLQACRRWLQEGDARIKSYYARFPRPWQLAWAPAVMPRLLRRYKVELRSCFKTLRRSVQELERWCSSRQPYPHTIEVRSLTMSTACHIPQMSAMSKWEILRLLLPKPKWHPGGPGRKPLELRGAQWHFPDSTGFSGKNSSH